MKKSKWNIASFKVYVDELRKTDSESIKTALASQEKLNQQVNLASEKAITKAEDKQNQYNQSHNDLLKKMEDMLPRKEADAREKNFTDKMEGHRKEMVAINSRLDIIAGRGSGYKELIGYILAAITILAFVITHYKA